MKTGFSAALMLVALGCAATWPVRAGASTASPVLIELFTSEGCSSCPPADAFLLQLDSLQPVPGAQLIVLSEHVDYWDHQGWPDPFSSTALTQRQSAYVRALGLHEAYTPQFIVDGTVEMRLSKRDQIASVLRKAAEAAKIPVQIDSLRTGAGGDASVSGRIQADGTAQRHDADVFIGLALDRIQSQVLRGENRGQLLTHVGVVEELTKIGTLTAQQKFTQDFRLPLKAGIDPSNIRVVVFVQESGLGKVVGAAVERTALDRSSVHSQL